MKLFESHQQFLEEKKKWEEEKNLADQLETKEYTSLDINWMPDDFSKEKPLQESNRDLIDLDKNKRLFLIAQSKDSIKGRPQLVETNKKKIVLIKKIFKIIKKEGGEDYLTQYKFIGQSFDKRYDGAIVDVLALDFWIYKLSDEKNLEHYLLSKIQLPNEVCEFKGMSISLNDSTEMSKTMKINSLSRIFIVKEFIPQVKVISKEELVEFTKKNKITESDWINFLGLHENGNINRFPKEVEDLRSAFILSGKVDGYPMHLGIMGRAGTKKTMGHIETLAFKFSDQALICEGASSTLKGLTPSFKEKPANIGYLVRSNRIGWIDEIGKMVEKELRAHQQQTGNYLGDMNFLLEHKKRLISSGNDNECQVQATAKFMFVTNPISSKETIQSHVNVIDPTFMSRIFWWVQDYNEMDFVMHAQSIIPKERFVQSPPHIEKNKSQGGVGGDVRENVLGIASMWGGNIGRDNVIFIDRNNFLTIFDSCYSFISDIDDSQIQRLLKITENIAKEPMKSSVWKPRAAHHIKLLIDGLCKHRCLFIDYDSSFKATEKDYAAAEAILFRMVKSWDTNFYKNPLEGGTL